MDPYTMFLLSMQAAGVVVSIYDKQSKEKLIQQGRSMEKTGIEMNMAANNYEFQESSLASMRALRQNLGTQAVMNAARGNASGTESAVGNVEKSVATQGADQEARRMKMLAHDAELRAQDITSGLSVLKSETELGRALGKDMIEAASTGVRQFEKHAALASKFGYGNKGANVGATK